MSKQKATMKYVKFDTQQAYSAMGAAIDLLVKAAPAMFENAPEVELQGKRKDHRQAA
ncbi:hypothetical protein KKJ09_20905 [Xenorhabdus bovienii]|uniref:Uncharacterized protein n=1 Tax=Xenorhabdus bovienii str. oregonense TaxID=1398202 RepID=A0A077P1J5_XENBV|nr:hypothetical protein [Xenorhabdus bovienii]MDE9447542.1 hypothetical protein [Xenorhabdus bovienii]MDE9495957.1 hypothetical protein [Xenorhabdus bovienii]MDE9504358.1 hypothetical protein [Xenorhabdus bovienii]MDE9528307.1 hypothetical protein [Xenorhabdus bovienii]CDH04940.1 conserved hypothetical protein [Xenorhabdus bovienii str. oregonense]